MYGGHPPYRALEALSRWLRSAVAERLGCPNNRYSPARLAGFGIYVQHVVQSFLAGDGGAKLLARRWSVAEEKIRTWVSHYRLHGIDGLRPKRSVYSAQFKLQVLSHQDREQLSSRQVAAIYDIRNPNQVVVWQQNLDAGGVAALENWKRGRTNMKPTTCRPVPTSTLNTDSAHVLYEEIERLRAEVAYLKKLHALIRARRSVAPTKRA